MKISKFYLRLTFASFGLALSSCDNVKTMYPETHAEIVASKELTEQNNSNEVNFRANSAAKTQWSTLNDDDKVNEIKRIVVSYGGELQGLGYSDAKILETADIYVLNADISEAKRLQLTKTLSELVGTPIVINILDSRVIDATGSLETLELSAINQDQVLHFSIDNDEQVNEVARIVEMHGAKLQSLAYDSDDFELSLQISYYPKKLTKSDFENLERELKQLTGVNVAIDRRSIMIKPL